jgi:hypothetical protein
MSCLSIGGIFIGDWFCNPKTEIRDKPQISLIAQKTEAKEFYRLGAEKNSFETKKSWQRLWLFLV